MKRAATVAITPIIRVVEWLFGIRAPGIDLWLGAFPAGWAVLMLAKPDFFDRGPLTGMHWLPDAAWITLFTSLAGLHLVGLTSLGPAWLRQTACLFSAWVWFTVSASIATVEITTGVVTYAIIGCFALAGALYLSGQPRKAG